MDSKTDVSSQEDMQIKCKRRRKRNCIDSESDDDSDDCYRVKKKVKLVTFMKPATTVIDGSSDEDNVEIEGVKQNRKQQRKRARQIESDDEDDVEANRELKKRKLNNKDIDDDEEIEDGYQNESCYSSDEEEDEEKEAEELLAMYEDRNGILTNDDPNKSVELKFDDEIAGCNQQLSKYRKNQCKSKEPSSIENIIVIAECQQYRGQLLLNKAKFIENNARKSNKYQRKIDECYKQAIDDITESNTLCLWAKNEHCNHLNMLNEAPCSFSQIDETHSELFKIWMQTSDQICEYWLHKKEFMVAIQKYLLILNQIIGYYHSVHPLITLHCQYWSTSHLAFAYKESGKINSAINKNKQCLKIITSARKQWQKEIKSNRKEWLQKKMKIFGKDDLTMQQSYTLLEIGFCYEQKNNAQKAINSFQKAAEVANKTCINYKLDGLYNAARVMADVDRYQEALKILESDCKFWLKVHPDNDGRTEIKIKEWDVENMIARIYLLTNPEKAKHSIERAINISKEYLSARPEFLRESQALYEQLTDL